MNQELEKKLWNKVENNIKKLQSIPFVRMIAICNSLAMGKFDKNSDIDLFIVAEKNRMFTVRALITLKLHLLGVRRHHSKIKERFCLSFFIDERNIDFSKIAIKDDIYLSEWINTLIPVIDNKNFLKNFRKKNSWISPILRKYNFKNKAINKNHQLTDKKSLAKILKRKILSGKIGDLIEEKLKNWQLRRAKNKSKKSSSSSLIINEQMLKFHEIDRREEYKKLFS